MTETTTAQTMTVLAELVLTANRLNLPTPLYLTTSEKNSQLNLTLNNRADFEAWHAVFGGGRVWECEPTEASPSVLVTNMHSGSLLGWSVNLQANVPPPLSAEVLAALGEAARSDAEAVAESLAVPAPVKELPATEQDEHRIRVFLDYYPGNPNGYWHWKCNTCNRSNCSDSWTSLDALGAGEEHYQAKHDAVAGGENRG